MKIKVILGPVLGFRGLNGDQWQTSALIITEESKENPQIIFKNPDSIHSNILEPKLLRTIDNLQVWRIEWSIQQRHNEQIIEYSVDENTYFSYAVPEKEKPLRIAYGSCFGFSKFSDMKKVGNKNQMWIELLKEHRRKPYHILINGGDQVYADMMFETLPSMKQWQQLKIGNRIKASFTKVMEKQVANFYFDLYRQRWGGQEEPAQAFRQIPTLMMWDDHDIFDGWGSYAKEQQNCEVFQGIYRHARDFFQLFQLQAAGEADLSPAVLDPSTGFSYCYRIGDLGIIMLDMRSERTQDQVMSLKSWNLVQDWMMNLSQKKLSDGSVIPGCRHLLVVSSIPVVYVNANIVETALGILPGQQQLEDDFRDQWMSHSHHEERLMLIHRLFSFSKESGCRVTIVSGDVHVGALGYIKSKIDFPVTDNENGINQLISSGMVHPPPPGLIVYMLEKVLGRVTDQIEQGITAEMLNFPGSSRRFLGSRNWLSMNFDDKGRIWAEWFTEEETKPYTKVILPI